MTIFQISAPAVPFGLSAVPSREEVRDQVPYQWLYRSGSRSKIEEESQEGVSSWTTAYIRSVSWTRNLSVSMDGTMNQSSFSWGENLNMSIIDDRMFKE